MTFYQELQLNQAGSKNLLKKSETPIFKVWVFSQPNNAETRLDSAAVLGFKPLTNQPPLFCL